MKTTLSNEGRLALRVVCEHLKARLIPLIKLAQEHTREHFPLGRDSASIEVRRAQHGRLVYITEAIDFSLNRLIDKVARLDAELISLEEALAAPEQ